MWLLGVVRWCGVYRVVVDVVDVVDVVGVVGVVDAVGVVVAVAAVAATAVAAAPTDFAAAAAVPPRRVVAV